MFPNQRAAEIAVDTVREWLNRTQSNIKVVFNVYKDIDLEITIKPYKLRRSNNANSYCWELIGKIADAMNLPAEEVYRNAIKAVGIYRDFPPMPKEYAVTLKTMWQNNGI